ncbi:MAG: hypothetical protein ACR2RF_11725 [Geminicoccaceae bacterium]
MAIELRGDGKVKDDAAAPPKPSRLEKITSALSAIEADDTIVDCIINTPGAFLWEFYKVWLANGGQDGGKNRNSIRRMRDVWLTDKSEVKSLHPKLTGKVRISKDDAKSLISLFLKRWRFVGVKEGDWILTADGYAPFPCQDCQSLCDRLIDAMYPEGSKQARSGLSLPVRPGDSQLIAASSNWTEIARLYNDLDAHITLSRHNSTIGPTPLDTTRLFWHVMNYLYETIGNKDTIFIWIVDIGGRQVEDSEAWKDFLNFEMLKTRFRAFASFDSKGDFDEHEETQTDRRSTEQSGIHGAFLRSLTIPEEGHREKRWKWLCERAIIVVQNLRKEEFQHLYVDEDQLVDKVRVRDINITAENFLPSMMPHRWSRLRELRELYGRDLTDISDATLTVHFKQIDQSTESAPYNDVRFFAHALSPDGESSDPTLASTTKSRELPPPDTSYSEAMRLIYWAARHRLKAPRGEKEAPEAENWAIAMAYLANQGFRAIRLPEFMGIHRSPGD